MSVSILVVDDEPDVAELFRQRFRREVRQGQYVMHFAHSGRGGSCASSATAIRPELIVMLSDINMPGMDGLGLVAARSSGAVPELPVIMVTAYGDDERRRGGAANTVLPSLSPSRSISSC